MILSCCDHVDPVVATTGIVRPVIADAAFAEGAGPAFAEEAGPDEASPPHPERRAEMSKNATRIAGTKLDARRRSIDVVISSPALPTDVLSTSPGPG